MRSVLCKFSSSRMSQTTSTHVVFYLKYLLSYGNMYFLCFQGSAEGITWTLDTFTRKFLGKLNSYPFNFPFQIYFATLSITRKRTLNINQVKKFFLFGFLNPFVTLADKIFGLKSIAAYRSGLKINTNVTLKEAQEGLTDVLRGEYLHLQSKFHFHRNIPEHSFCLTSGSSCPHHE